MGVQTGIEWCDATWNPWVGCTKVSEGCANCYMFREQQRWDNDPEKIRQTKGARQDLPRRKTRDGEWKIPSGSFVFVCSWSDFFHESLSWEWRYDAFSIMRRRSDCTFLILTKRPEVMTDMIPRICGKLNEPDYSGGFPNVWLGVTAENQARADERIPQLLKINWPGKMFVSVEPMLGPVDISAWLPCPKCRGRGWYLPYFSANTGVPCEECQKHARDKGVYLPPGTYAAPGARLDWVICGGESGPNHRECKEEWARSLKDQCEEAGVPFFLKQYSANKPAHMPVLDGKRWAERPTMK